MLLMSFNFSKLFSSHSKCVFVKSIFVISNKNTGFKQRCFGESFLLGIGVWLERVLQGTISRSGLSEIDRLELILWFSHFPFIFLVQWAAVYGFYNLRLFSGMPRLRASCLGIYERITCCHISQSSQKSSISVALSKW